MLFSPPMDSALLTVAAGMRARIESLEVLGNNLANSGTTGYKRDQEFYRLFLAAQAAPDTRLGRLPWMPVVEGSFTDYTQGPLVKTEAPLDLALSGPGFFVVEGPNGPLYTRNGHFTRNAAGEIVTADGHRLLDDAEAPITLPGEGKIEVSENGLIELEGLPLARIAVVEFAGRPPLRKAGNNEFTASAQADPQPAAETVVRQGTIEASNVNVPRAAVEMILATRNFEMLSRIARLVGDDMNGRAVEQLARTS